MFRSIVVKFVFRPKYNAPEICTQMWFRRPEGKARGRRVLTDETDERRSHSGMLRPTDAHLFLGSCIKSSLAAVIGLNLVSILGGCSSDERANPSQECAPHAVFASEVKAYSFGTGATYGQDRFPDAVFGAPEGAGCCQGSLDVVTLGNGGSVTVGFGTFTIVDGPGPDFLVFENAFRVGTSERVFAELATVEVSEDGEHWVAFPCTATQPPYGTCAGWHPVFASGEHPELDPTDPTQAGGDPFDLADLGLAKARFVRITDRLDLDGLDGTFDLDAVAVVHASCE